MLAPWLTATLNSDGSITLTRSASDGGPVTGYHVLLRRPKEGEETFIVCASDMGNTATDPDTRYGYHVKAENAHGLSGVSNFARVDTWLLSGNTANAGVAQQMPTGAQRNFFCTANSLQPGTSPDRKPKAEPARRLLSEDRVNIYTGLI